jgi:hypothetical protein
MFPWRLRRQLTFTAVPLAETIIMPSRTTS